MQLNALFGALKTSFAPLAPAPQAPAAPAAARPPRMQRDAFLSNPANALNFAMMRLDASIANAKNQMEKLSTSLEALGRGDWLQSTRLESQLATLNRQIEAPRQLAYTARGIMEHPAATPADRARLEQLVRQVASGATPATGFRAAAEAQDIERNIGRSPKSDRGLHQATLGLADRLGETQSAINALDAEMGASASGQRIEQVPIVKMGLEQHFSNAQSVKWDADRLALNPNASPEAVAKMRGLVAEMTAGTPPGREAALVAQARALAAGTPAPLARALEGVARRAGAIDTRIAALTDEVKMGAGGQRLQEIQLTLQDLMREQHDLHKVAVHATRVASEGGDVAWLTGMAREVGAGMRGERLQQIVAQLEP